MKKKNFKSFKLNKTSISSFKSSSIRGGKTGQICENQSYGTCDQEPLTSQQTDCDCH